MVELPVDSNLLGLTARIVLAHVANNPLQAGVLPMLIRDVYKTLSHINKIPAEPAGKPQPSVPIGESVFADYIICLEDGKKLKMLKRHLATSFNLTPEQYRVKWGLDPGYPMVAPNYAEKRSSLAKQSGLGTRRAAE